MHREIAPGDKPPVQRREPRHGLTLAQAREQRVGVLLELLEAGASADWEPPGRPASHVHRGRDHSLGAVRSGRRTAASRAALELPRRARGLIPSRKEAPKKPRSSGFPRTFSPSGASQHTDCRPSAGPSPAPATFADAVRRHALLDRIGRARHPGSAVEATVARGTVAPGLRDERASHVGVPQATAKDDEQAHGSRPLLLDESSALQRPARARAHCPVGRTAAALRRAEPSGAALSQRGRGSTGASPLRDGRDQANAKATALKR